jgi:hypothetical protein
MTSTFTKTAAFVLAALLTSMTCAGANTLAASQRAKAESAAHVQVLPAQVVTIVGHRAA